jgi:hypothetical protein
MLEMIHEKKKEVSQPLLVIYKIQSLNFSVTDTAQENLTKYCSIDCTIGMDHPWQM